MWKSEWHNPGTPLGRPQDVFERMKKRRRHILIHSYLYYGVDDTVWSDAQWDVAARDLYELQQKWGWNIGFYDNIFEKWEGQSGYWLPTNTGCDEHVVRVALRTLKAWKTRKEKA